jgi:hypothetical protein
MPNIESIYLSNSMIEEIPDNAFRPPNGTQNKLAQISFLGNRITKVGSNAFSQLKSLEFLQLGSNPISHITENAFNFLNTSEIRLNLDVHASFLNSSSFDEGAFSHLNRPTILYFGESGPNITYLDQHIFEQFLNNNDKNGIKLYSIDCNDCRSFWLFSNQKYSKRSSNELFCSNRKEFTDKSNFQECVVSLNTKKYIFIFENKFLT